MSEEENMDQAPKTNDTPEDVNGNTSQDQTIEQLQTQSENMEVHHHPDLHHKKKNFKEYFLEFLMIFLAVTMGFIAENLRETYNDKGNIHQLAISLMNDLKMDTTHLTAQLQRSNLKIKQLDSLHAILQQPKDKINYLDLQRLVVGATLVFNFVPSSGTISEMKSTGILRLFSDTKIPGLINSYESIISSTKIIENFEIDYSRKYIEEGFMSKHFTPENIFKYADSASLSSHSFIPVNNKLRNITQDDLVQFNVDLVLYKIDALFLNIFYEKDYQMAVDFMKDIQEEFKLRNE